MRYFFDSGDIYIGQLKNNKKTEGRHYKLQEDQTHTLFKIKYDENEKVIEKKEISRGHKMV